MEDRLRNGCIVQKMNGILAKRVNQMFQAIRLRDQAGRFLGHYLSWQGLVKYLGFTNLSALIEW